MKTIGDVRSVFGFGDNKRENKEDGMCRADFRSRLLIRSMRGLAVCAFLAVIAGMPRTAVGQAVHNASQGKRVENANGGGTQAHVGDTINVTMTFENLDGFGDTYTVTNMHDQVNEANCQDNQRGTTFREGPNTVTVPITLQSALFTPSAEGTTKVTRSDTYTVLAGDPDNLPDCAITFFIDNCDGATTDCAGFPQGATKTQPASLRILRPCISVTKIITNCPPSPDNPVILFTGVVRNCGNTALFGVTLVDDHAGNRSEGDT